MGDYADSTEALLAPDGANRREEQEEPVWARPLRPGLRKRKSARAVGGKCAVHSASRGRPLALPGLTAKQRIRCPDRFWILD